MSVDDDPLLGRTLAGRYRLITNVGEDAGQVVRHLHWHVMGGGTLSLSM